MNNIFTAIISTLNTIPITGEENHRKMIAVLDLLHRMERAADEPDKEEEVRTDG